jgi:hypothetical protein
MEGRLVWKLPWSNLIDRTTNATVKYEICFSAKGISRKKQIKGNIVAVAITLD